MENTKEVREEMAAFVALETGHFAPFFINADILSKRGATRTWPAWPRPAWYHSAFCTLPDVTSLRLVIQGYRELFEGLGFDLILRTVMLAEDEMEAWRAMQPPPQYLKRVGPS